MAKVSIKREQFLRDRRGRTFADVLNDPDQPFDEVLEFFNDEARQRRMEESEIQHDRAPLASVVLVLLDPEIGLVRPLDVVGHRT